MAACLCFLLVSAPNSLVTAESCDSRFFGLAHGQKTSKTPGFSEVSVWTAKASSHFVDCAPIWFSDSSVGRQLL